MNKQEKIKRQIEEVYDLIQEIYDADGMDWGDYSRLCDAVGEIEKLNEDCK